VIAGRAPRPTENDAGNTDHETDPELARSIALFEHTVTGTWLEVLGCGWSQQLFQCSVTEYVAVAFLF
jgi:hypothetical protein